MARINWKTRLAEALLGEEKRKLEQTTRTLYEAYMSGPFEMAPDVLVDKLREIDPSVLQDLISQIQYEQIGALGYSQDTSAEHRRAVDESRRLWKYDVLTQWMVGVWTNFGFGENVQVVPDDDSGKESWDEFWDSDRNEPVLSADRLHHLSNRLLVDGELFLAFFISILDGKSTVRRINPDEIVEFVKDPEDRDRTLFYKRTWTTSKGDNRSSYYPDWQVVMSEDASIPDDLLPVGSSRADKDGETDKRTTVVLMHLAHNVKEGDRGWPLLMASAPWIREHRRFRENRAAVSAAVAMYVNKLKVQGGSRAVDAVKRTMASALNRNNLVETNPAAVAGSTWIENQSADIDRMPLTTGAGDAKTDGEGLLLMAGLGGGLFPHWLGAGDAYRLATATSMETPLIREFSRYQKFWSSAFRKMVKIVLWGTEKYGQGGFQDDTAEVSTDRLIETDLSMLVSSARSMVTDILMPALSAGIMPPDTALLSLAAIWRSLLQAYGVDDANDLASDKLFKSLLNDIKKARKLVAAQAEKLRQNLAKDSGEEEDEGEDAADEEETDEEEEEEPTAAAETLNPLTGNFTPKGQAAHAWADNNVPLTAEDVEAAIRDWNARMPADFYGMLSAHTKKGSNGKNNTVTK